MRSFFTTPLFALALASIGCASGMSYDEIEDRLPQLGRGEGRVFFYRSGSMFGAAIQPEIHLDGRVAGTSQPGGFFFVDRPAGPCEIACSTEVERKVAFDLAAGDTRYVRSGISLGIFVGRVTPELVPPQVGAKEIRNKKYTGARFPGLREAGN